MFAIITSPIPHDLEHISKPCVRQVCCQQFVFQMGEAETRLPGQLTYKTSEDGEDASEPVSWQGLHSPKNETVSQTVEKYQLLIMNS